jgi:hypothetical protein
VLAGTACVMRYEVIYFVVPKQISYKVGHPESCDKDNSTFLPAAFVFVLVFSLNYFSGRSV